MDIKTLIAFIIIGLVVAFIPYYQRLVSPGDRVEEGPGRQEVSSLSEEPEESEQPAKAEVLSEKIVPHPPAVEGRLVPFRNGVVVGDFSTSGGVVVSWKLRDYRLSGNGPVELVPEGGSGGGISIYQEGQALDLRGVEFLPSADSLVVGPGGTGSIAFVADLGDGRKVRKRFSLTYGSYVLGVDVMLQGFKEAESAFVFHWDGGIANTEKGGEDFRLLKAFTYMGGELEPFVVKKPEGLSETRSGVLDWVAVRNKYFLAAIIPKESGESEVGLYGVEHKDLSWKRYDISVRGSVGNGVWARDLVYIGPQTYDDLKAFGVGLEEVMDLGVKWFRPIAKVILKVFLLLKRAIPNYGVVIIVFSLIIKILVYPLTRKTFSATSKMQDLQPKITEIRQKYKNDPQKMNSEMMKLYKERGVNPVGGCLPMLLQLPVFFALFAVFRNTIELRQAGFVLWLKDLSQPDPYYVLPILMGITMFIQQKMTVKDPKQATMVYVMPVVMTFLFVRFASGLVLYWTMFNVLTLVQQLLLKDRASPA